MKKQAILCVLVFFVAGCASGSKIAGRSPSHFGPSADQVWQEQLGQASSGSLNPAVFRAVRGEHVYYGDDRKTRRAKVGSTLCENTGISTGDDSQVDVFLGVNGPVL